MISSDVLNKARIEIRLSHQSEVSVPNDHLHAQDSNCDDVSPMQSSFDKSRKSYRGLRNHSKASENVKSEEIRIGQNAKTSYSNLRKVAKLEKVLHIKENDSGEAIEAEAFYQVEPYPPGRLDGRNIELLRQMQLLH